MAPQSKPYEEELEITLPSLSPLKQSKEPAVFFPPFSPLEETQQKQSQWVQEQQQRRLHKSSKDLSADCLSSPASRDIVFSPLDTTATPSRKTVAFAPVIKYKTVRHISEYSQEEIDGLFYGDEDLDDIRAECGETVRRMVEKERIPEDKYCIRGLEYKTPGGADFRRKNKRRALRAVLEEQRKQIEMGVINDESLSEAYMRSSDKCKRIARFLAARDEEEIHKSSKSRSRSKKAKSSRRASTSGSSPSNFDIESNPLTESPSKSGQKSKASRRASTSNSSTSSSSSNRIGEAGQQEPVEEPYYLLPTPEKLSGWKTMTFSNGDGVSFASATDADDETESIIATRPLLSNSS